MRRMTPQQYNAWVRQQQQERERAIRRHNQEVDRVNRANKAAAEKALRDYNREVDRVNQHNRRVVAEANREIDRINQQNRRVADHNRRVYQQNRAAVDKYNRAVRAHNAGLDRQRQRQLAALRANTSPRYVEVRESTFDLSARFERAVQEAVSAELIALSEREASNSAAVAETLLQDEPTALPATEDTGILEYLQGFSQDLCDRWRGAIYALNPANPDAGRHFCTSAREIFTEILDKWADNKDVLNADPTCELTPNKTAPSRRAKIRYLLKRKGADTPEMLGFVEKDIDDILQLFHVFNEATHGAAGKHGFTKLLNIRQRVEGGIMFLAAVAL
jgi:hypothetical protein